VPPLVLELELLLVLAGDEAVGILALLFVYWKNKFRSYLETRGGRSGASSLHPARTAVPGIRTTLIDF